MEPVWFSQCLHNCRQLRCFSLESSKGPFSASWLLSCYCFSPRTYMADGPVNWLLKPCLLLIFEEFPALQVECGSSEGIEKHHCMIETSLLRGAGAVPSSGFWQGWVCHLLTSQITICKPHVCLRKLGMLLHTLKNYCAYNKSCDSIQPRSLFWVPDPYIWLPV